MAALASLKPWLIAPRLGCPLLFLICLVDRDTAILQLHVDDSCVPLFVLRHAIIKSKEKPLIQRPDKIRELTRHCCTPRFNTVTSMLGICSLEIG